MNIESRELERLKIFRPKGGFVFNSLYDIQTKVPVENILAMF